MELERVFELPLPAAEDAREALTASGIAFTEETGWFFTRFVVCAADAQRAQAALDRAESEHASRDAW